jgi:hypothetical protein
MAGIRKSFVERDKKIGELSKIILEQMEILKYQHNLSNSFIAYTIYSAFLEFCRNNFSDSKRVIKKMLTNTNFIRDEDEEIPYVY